MAATTGAGNSCTALSPRFGGGTERTAAAGRPGQLLDAYNFLATVENVPVRLLPTVLNTVTAATEINAAIRPYSIAVAAVWSRNRCTMLFSMFVPIEKDDPADPAFPLVPKLLSHTAAVRTGINSAVITCPDYSGVDQDSGANIDTRNHINPQQRLRPLRWTILRSAASVSEV